MTAPDDRSRSRLRIGAIVALVSALALLCCGGVTTSFFVGGLGGDSDDTFAFGCGSATSVEPNDEDLPRAGSLGEEQTRNAAIIIRVGQDQKLPPRAWIIAVATAMQESWLRNLGHLGDRNDHDSLGLFQQRPSQGWGSAEQIRNPQHAAAQFYMRLIEVAGWEKLPLTEAAQKVQISAYPDAYAKHERLATQIVNVLTDGAARAAGTSSDLRCVTAGEISASGWTVPVQGGVVSEFRSTERPTHHGVDLKADRGTPIHAASGGVVVRVRCNAVAPGGWNWGCDRDGSPSIRGCGWYVDIMHAGLVITRYCHMATQPRVSLGQQVAAGEQIGVAGSTGRSSGPHLHFEVHVGGDSTSGGATDPVEFMKDQGAPLGGKL